jgi:ABC-type transport system involved in multi-copper enzyme maturation permease subunit
MRRELAIAVRAPITWVVAAVSALLVGHGFILSVDLYSASSRSVLASALQAREMDPLAGIVRPTLGGLDLAIALFVPLVAARVLSVDKERRTLGALCLLEGSSDRVVLKKLVAALSAATLSFVAPVVAFVALRAVGGHVDGIETALALAGEGLHVLLIAAVSVAAASWTRTLAQAATLGILISLSSWAIDAADGFAALAWLGGVSAWSVERQLGPFQQGIVSAGSLVWLLAASAGAAVLALTGARFDSSRVQRAAVAVATVLVLGLILFAAAKSHRAYDWSEQRRASLPPAAVDGLRRIAEPLALDVFLDRDDSRRRQLESDVIAKLYLARPDLTVRTPLDERETVAEGQHDLDYGRILIRVGSASKETRSTSRREIVSLIFDAAGKPLPDWSMPAYGGFPFVAEGVRRTTLALVAYFVVPFAFLVTGVFLTRRRSVR